ncbi:contact-dependent growth inhibition system immunity protein [Neobacillus niacini]|uniref:contact-dependent growth inhibition system immunity protein n=1 Tax=Neobacillus niacini TaxID=86668 RepID=UPI0028614B5B|nr:contact-dependent growth inhibition system immunity protein [Neobacillus niacini]MDR6999662.1 hypothetical protein [Neobacillus niacini]
MLFTNKLEEPVFQFLAGTFHQDIESPEEAFHELLSVESKEYLENAIVFLTDFVRSEYSDNDKNEYIQYCADGVYFPDLGVEPLEWLNNIIEEIKEVIKTK